MYYFYSVICNRIRHNCCCCCCYYFWLTIQIMYSPANRFFSFSKCSRGGTILIMCTQCILQLHETQTFYMQYILGVLIIIWLKMTIMKSLMKCFLFAQKFSVVYLVIKWRHNTYISFIYTILKIKLFWQTTGNFIIKIKTCRKFCVIIP